jgi:hypothetical protein
MFMVQLTFSLLATSYTHYYLHGVKLCSCKSKHKVNSCVNKSPERLSKEMDVKLRSLLFSALQSSSQITTSTIVSASGSKTACSQIQYPYPEFEIRFFISILCFVRKYFQVQILNKSLIIKQFVNK